MTDRARLNKKSNTKDKNKIIIPDIIFHAQIEEVKQDDTSDDLFIQGLASTPDVDRTDDIVEPSAFKKTLKDFMRNPVLLHNHGMGSEGRVPVGKIVEAEIKTKGLFVKALISKTEDKLREKIKEGLYQAFSFGFRIINSDIIKKAGKSIRKITELELFEVSIVSIPANRRALFSIVKGFEVGTDLIYENNFVNGLIDNIKGLQEDLNLDHERIYSVEKEVKNLKELYDSSERTCFKEAEKEATSTNKIKCTGAQDECEICKGTKEDNLHDPTTNKDIKSLKEEVSELKAGRILSDKNRKTLALALKAMGSALTELKAVLNIQEAESHTEEEAESKEQLVDDRFDEKILDDITDKVAEATIGLVQRNMIN